MQDESMLNEDLDVKDVIKENVETKGLDKDQYIAKLNDDLIEQKKKSEEYFENLKRNMADFDNFKKRITREKDSIYFNVTVELLEDLLPILDNFEIAINAECTDKVFKDGMVMIFDKLKETLEKLGLEEIEALNEEFDPNLHEAVMYVEDSNYSEKQIVEVLRKGYKKGDKVIRHTMVKVAN